MQWGILGPDALPARRRTRGLGLGSAVRHFNELAVPGLGGLWFAKPVFLALLGIRLAEQCEEQPIQVANAVEALGCWLALNRGKHREEIRDPRLRGRRKLRQYSELPTYSKISQAEAYVSQPTRRSTTAALPALGLVAGTGRQFNGMTLSEDGEDLLQREASCFRSRKQNMALVRCLLQWMKGQAIAPTPSLAKALSPLEPLSEPVRTFLRDRILSHGPGATRRRAVAAWLAGDVRVDWDEQPEVISADHWRDLRAGAAFFAFRNAALKLLDEIERHIATPRGEFRPREHLPAPIAEQLAEVRARAQAFIEQARDVPRVPELKPALALATDMNADDHVAPLLRLVGLDGRGLEIRDQKICPGPMFRGAQAAQGPDHDTSDADEADGEGDPDRDEDAAPATAGEEPALPPDISSRVRNLYLVMADLGGKPDDIQAENA